MRTPIARLLLPAAVFLATFLTGCAAWRIDQGRELARLSEPFAVMPPGATARLLIVGDSTAVGTGATSPAMSVAGRLAAAHPKLTIVNRGEDGALYSAVVEQIRTAPPGPYDAVLILAGGNDVIFLTSEAKLREAMDEAVIRAQSVARVVIIMPPGNVGNAPFFFPPLSWAMSARARTLHANAREVATLHGVAYVNLYQPKESDPFAQQPKLMHAADGLHPSDEGYALWFRDLMSQSPLSKTL